MSIFICLFSVMFHTLSLVYLLFLGFKDYTTPLYFTLKFYDLKESSIKIFFRVFYFQSILLFTALSHHLSHPTPTLTIETVLWKFENRLYQKKILFWNSAYYIASTYKAQVLFEIEFYFKVSTIESGTVQYSKVFVLKKGINLKP